MLSIEPPCHTRAQRSHVTYILLSSTKARAQSPHISKTPNPFTPPVCRQFQYKPRNDFIHILIPPSPSTHLNLPLSHILNSSSHSFLSPFASTEGEAATTPHLPAPKALLAYFRPPTKTYVTTQISHQNTWKCNKVASPHALSKIYNSNPKTFPNVKKLNWIKIQESEGVKEEEEGEIWGWIWCIYKNIKHRSDFYLDINKRHCI